jgi:hypothetical protein
MVVRDREQNAVVVHAIEYALEYFQRGSVRRLWVSEYPISNWSDCKGSLPLGLPVAPFYRWDKNDEVVPYKLDQHLGTLYTYRPLKEELILRKAMLASSAHQQVPVMPMRGRQ